MNDQIQNIEEAVAHQDQQIEELSTMVAKQWDMIDMLKKRLERMQDKIEYLEKSLPADGDAGDTPMSVTEQAARDKPPHY